jgi:flagellar motility protein MotE (MotC chaperone)
MSHHELKQLKIVLDKNKAEVFEMEITRRRLEKELSRKWKHIDSLLDDVRTLEESIANELFIIENEDGNFWRSHDRWIMTIPGATRMKKSELPEVFKGMKLSKNGHDDPIKWRYHDDNDEAVFYITRVKIVAGKAVEDR